MYHAKTEIICSDAEKYIEMLRKHFAQKVSTEKGSHESQVHFTMGECLMNWQSGNMRLHCKAKHKDALQAVVQILESHLHMIREIKGRNIDWVVHTV